MHMHIDICLRLRQLKQLPRLCELFVKQNSNTFLFHLKQFSEIMIVRENKTCLSCLTFRNHALSHSGQFSHLLTYLL